MLFGNANAQKISSADLSRKHGYTQLYSDTQWGWYCSYDLIRDQSADTVTLYSSGFLFDALTASRFPKVRNNFSSEYLIATYETPKNSNPELNGQTIGRYYAQYNITFSNNVTTLKLTYKDKTENYQILNVDTFQIEPIKYPLSNKLETHYAIHMRRL